ncbi:copper resistance CopC family protein [Paractinoplanes durhamensis]|uniref:CopC domain-containing protein n=1 Tax=Paractinoplanes durhamensis TaxID=113563 RepID=A0ABQ3Z3P8_9ACTN|nr:copper resistance CopC family protein [Actinoplanes durhamensis]GIE04435.1 hypothetical protein Adu01nite_57850 [Actinoplanes durhamensis]
MRRTLLAAAALLVVLLPGAPAWAHTSLLSSVPARDATLAKAPASVALTFSQRLNPDFTTIVVSDAAKQRVPASKPAVEQAVGTVTFDQPLGNGVYTVAYRVVSSDGHTVQGSYPFTVADPALTAATAPAAAASAAAPSAVAPSAVAPAAAAPAAADGPGSGGIPAGVQLGLAAAGVLLAGGAIYLFVSARRKATAQR